MLPEYFIEDVVDFYLFLVRYVVALFAMTINNLNYSLFSHQPESLSVSGKKELVDFIIIFLSSTWYIKNPYLKAKLVTVRLISAINFRLSMLTLPSTDSVLRHYSIRPGEKWSSRRIAEHTPTFVETFNALLDVILCR